MVGVRRRSGQRAGRFLGLLAGVSSVAVLVLFAACERSGQPAERAPAASALSRRGLEEICSSDLDLRAASSDTLGACEALHADLARRYAGAPDAVAHGRAAAKLARARARHEPQGAHLARARAYLEEAARRRDLEGACDASLELARLLANELGDPIGAYVRAYRTARQFEGVDALGCATAARAMLDELGPFRPGSDVLAAIDLDPDADDPRLDLRHAAGTSPGAGGDALARWARERAVSSRVVLRSIETFGDVGQDARRIVVTLSDVAQFETRELAAEPPLPRRFVVRFVGATMGDEVPPVTSAAGGGLVRVRAARQGDDVHVSLDLDSHAAVSFFVLPEPFRIVLDVRAQRPEVPETGARARRPLRLLVLDPGHGGDDHGARAFGLAERDLTLDLARRVRAILAARLPGVTVILTREENRFVSLEQRTAIANAVGADAFVSIHFNAAWEDVQHGGVTSFVLDTTDDRQALRLAARENGTSEREVGALSRILAALHREEQVRGSRALAEHIHEATLAAGRRVLPRLYDRGVRTAMFHVLVGATMPAVLVEASFLTRREEAEALRTARYRQALAEGIADGIVGFARGVGID